MKKIKENKKGATFIEYGLVVALIALVAIIGVTALGKTTSSKFQKTSDTIKYR